MTSYSVILIVFLSLLVGCSIIIGKSEYDSIGNYRTRVDAQNKAVKRFVEKYSLLPIDRYYKVKYAIPDAPLNEQRENAVWYHKGNATLVFESDVSSGPFCTWKGVNKAILEEANNSANSFAKIDSLSIPMQSFRDCQ